MCLSKNIFQGQLPPRCKAWANLFLEAYSKQMLRVGELFSCFLRLCCLLLFGWTKRCLNEKAVWLLKFSSAFGDGHPIGLSSARRFWLEQLIARMVPQYRRSLAKSGGRESKSGEKPAVAALREGDVRKVLSNLACCAFGT